MLENQRRNLLKIIGNANNSEEPYFRYQKYSKDETK